MRDSLTEMHYHETIYRKGGLKEYREQDVPVIDSVGTTTREAVPVDCFMCHKEFYVREGEENLCFSCRDSVKGVRKRYDRMMKRLEKAEKMANNEVTDW